MNLDLNVLNEISKEGMSKLYGGNTESAHINNGVHCDEINNGAHCDVINHGRNCSAINNNKVCSEINNSGNCK
jgi:hypothetical protein